MTEPLPQGDGLPVGFGWAFTFGERPTLFYLSAPVADFQPAGGEGWIVHTSLQRMDHQQRRIHLASRVLAIRYCEAYVCRWEGRIRADLGHLRGSTIAPAAADRKSTRLNSSH